jgi:hypothetical protein
MVDLFQILKILPTDYSDYGGEIKRWEDLNKDYPDCASGCKHFLKLDKPFTNDWGVCANKKSPRCSLLTWEHQAGLGCFEKEEP